ncbi:Protein kinase-like domain [Pseudocohnilembus persalinus]|uniref:Protein kinase-like domain n=1 Tax=Pseudocohnilembus persalinus TaxID=266149 RepID=A0A0V0QUP9_PSEPJ|nr:Protein kinase-like domain [Pseudocohnilembus persalinus]|eukprot:KRX05770.1 Protein kinase-like domain [Pseudocohnilembus persalinus]
MNNSQIQLDEEFLQKYTLEENILLGKGAFAFVLLCYKKNQPGKHYAVKVTDNNELKKKPHLQEYYDREIQISLKLKQTNNQNLVQLEEHFKGKKYRYQILEYCCQGDLFKLIQKQKFKRFEESKAIQIFKQILNGMSELHKNHMIHRDLKLQNILMSNWQVKIADFGIAKQLESETQKTETFAGTIVTMAPEIVRNNKYNIQCDVYSLGVILYQLVYGITPFNILQINQLKTDINQKIKNFPINFNYAGVKISNNLQDLITKMLIFDPNQRINFIGVWNHPALNIDNDDIFKGKVSNQQGQIYNLGLDKNKAINIYEDVNLQKIEQKTELEIIQEEESYQFGIYLDDFCYLTTKKIINECENILQDIQLEKNMFKFEQKNILYNNNQLIKIKGLLEEIQQFGQIQLFSILQDLQVENQFKNDKQLQQEINKEQFNQESEKMIKLRTNNIITDKFSKLEQNEQNEQKKLKIQQAIVHILSVLRYDDIKSKHNFDLNQYEEELSIQSRAQFIELLQNQLHLIQ